MVKKCLIAIAVVAMLATTVQAASSIKIEGWPWTKVYDEVDICTFDVLLEVGHFVQIENCDDLEMKLYQVDCAAIGQTSDEFPCYGDYDEFDVPGPACVTISAKANFDALFGAVFTGGTVDIVGGSSLTWPLGDEIIGDGTIQDLKLCMTAWSVALWNSGATSGNVTVGTITINVKPKDVTGP